MSLKESFVFLLLAGGVMGAIAGLALVSRGESWGWIAVGIAAPMLFVAQRSMRVVQASIDDKPPTVEPGSSEE